MSEKPLAANHRLSRRTWLSAVLILIVIPATILLGIFVLDDRKYYFISLLIVFYTMLPFALVFEQRKPQARELIVIAVLAAIAVAGRSAFLCCRSSSLLSPSLLLRVSALVRRQVFL